MRRAVLFLLPALILLDLSVDLQRGSAETPPPHSTAMRSIALDVLIVDLKGGVLDEQLFGLSGSSEEVATQLQELEAAGRIARMDRIRSTVVENQKAVMQTGTTAAIATARSSGGRGAGTQTSYQQQKLGTLMSAIATADGDAVVVELQVEKTQLEQRADRSPAEGEFVPPAIATLTLQTSLRIGGGKTVLAGGLETRTDAMASGQIVLVSARLMESALESASDAGDLTPTDGGKVRSFRSFVLQNERAEDAARVVKEVLEDKQDQIRIIVDARTNSLMVSTENESDLDDVEAILSRLDQGAENPPDQTPEGEKKAGPPRAAARYDAIQKEQLREELARLQTEDLDAERRFRQAEDTRKAAAAAYSAASDDQKGEALLRMLEADAASREPLERWKKIHRDFETAQRAYSNLLIAQ